MIPHGERRKAICFLYGTHRDQRGLPLFGHRSGNKAVRILLSETKITYLDEVICISYCYYFFTPDCSSAASVRKNILSRMQHV